MAARAEPVGVEVPDDRREGSGTDLFTVPYGRPIDPSWSWHVFYKALKAAGIPRVRFHNLRETAARLLLMQGVHPKVDSDMLTHSTVGLTLDTYSHLLPAMHPHAAAARDAILAGKVLTWNSPMLAVGGLTVVGCKRRWV